MATFQFSSIWVFQWLTYLAATSNCQMLPSIWVFRWLTYSVATFPCSSIPEAFLKHWNVPMDNVVGGHLPSSSIEVTNLFWKPFSISLLTATTDRCLYRYLVHPSRKRPFQSHNWYTGYATLLSSRAERSNHVKPRVAIGDISSPIAIPCLHFFYILRQTSDWDFVQIDPGK